ncbi:MAG: hypothetical protein IPJ38_18780 [Dechloromonas sp.]|uniref:Uncharacterized protein n=1 Tax=Candidatus Dechloromonas phosphorivorans TaxID=2899244 RepID=A0A935MUM4_9RHOO|nr:hypothetical protein [Candidatus Dechloromonas phosphorivorans]
MAPSIRQSSVVIYATGTVANRNNFTGIAKDGIGVKMGLNALVQGVAASGAKVGTSSAIEIDNQTSTVVMNLVTEIEQALKHGLGNPALLQSCLSMMGHG